MLVPIGRYDYDSNPTLAVVIGFPAEASLGLEIHDAKTFFDMLTGVSDASWRFDPVAGPLVFKNTMAIASG